MTSRGSRTRPRRRAFARRCARCETWRTARPLRARDNTRSVRPRGNEPVAGPPSSCGGIALGEKNSCLRLQNGQQIDGHHVLLVLGAFLRCQRSFITLAGEPVDGSLRLSIRAQSDQLARRFFIQGSTYLLEDTFEQAPAGSFTHARS